jgi:hypothetical protein
MKWLNANGISAIQQQIFNALDAKPHDPELLNGN